MRVVVEGRCQACGHALLQDLPTGYGRLYPTTLDLDTGEAWGRWFPDLLIEGWAEPDDDPVPFEIVGSASGSAVVFLPALDFVYGHALMALLNAQHHIDAGDRVVVLVPRSLAHLVPSDVDEAWIVDAPFDRLRGWLTDLDHRVSHELSRFEKVVLSPVFPRPHPSLWDLVRFTGALDEERYGEPSIVFAARSDRLWSKNADGQRRRFEDVLAGVRHRLPTAGGTIVGVGVPTGPDGGHGMRDLRSSMPSRASEERWLRILVGADVVIGVHGSNMLLPSGLSRATIELLPEDRFGNFGDASLLTVSDPARVLFRHRTLMGSADLSDVTADRVAAVALALLEGTESFQRTVLGPGSGLEPLAAAHPDREPVWHGREANRPTRRRVRVRKR